MQFVLFKISFLIQNLHLTLNYLFEPKLLKRGQRSIVCVNFATLDLKVKEGKHFENFDFFQKMTKKNQSLKI